MNSVAGLLMQLQAEVLGYSLVVPVHHSVDNPNNDVPDSAISQGVLSLCVGASDSPRQPQRVTAIVPYSHSESPRKAGQGRARQGRAGQGAKEN